MTEQNNLNPLETIEFYQNSLKIVLVQNKKLTCIKDQQGRIAWLFTENTFLKKYLNNNLHQISIERLRKIPPPWAAVIKGINDEGTTIVTDVYGLQQIYMRQIDATIFVGTDLIKIASVGDVHIDYSAVFELMCRGNPQGERTLFQEVKSLFGASRIVIKNTITKENYWKFQEPETMDEQEVVDVFAKTLLKIVNKRFTPEIVLELTAGRDSMLLLSAFLHEKLPINAWTHGFHDTTDLLGAQARARHFSINHQAIRLEPLLELSPEDVYKNLDEYVSKSQGMANVIEYWFLPWILKQVHALKSITGVGGEVFRGFYYEWMGKRYLPRKIGKYFLIHGKLREHMPFNPDYLCGLAIDASHGIIEQDISVLDRYSSSYWQSLDLYYLRHRMHYFSGTTFSTTQHWLQPELPLFDPELINLLPFIPFNLRANYNGINDLVIRKLLKESNLSENVNPYGATSINRMVRLINRSRQLQGTWLKGRIHSLALKIIDLPEIKNMLNIDSMKSGHLYKSGKFKKNIEFLYSRRKNIPLPIGASITIEAVCRKITSNILQ